jgi:hypothetical protein
VTTHGPEQSVHRGRLLTKEIPSTIVGGRCLRDLAVWTGLNSVDEVWKLDCILDKEDGLIPLAMAFLCSQNMLTMLFPTMSNLHQYDVFSRGDRIEGLTKVAFISVETDSKAVHIADCIG